MGMMSVPGTHGSRSFERNFRSHRRVSFFNFCIFWVNKKLKRVVSGQFTGHDPTHGSSQESRALKKLTGRVGSDQKVFEVSLIGSGRSG